MHERTEDSRDEAMGLHDEVGNADDGGVFTAKRFMAHFPLKKQVDNGEGPRLRSRQSYAVFASTGEYSALADCRTSNCSKESALRPTLLP